MVATLPQVAKLDGEEVLPSERIAAKQVLPRLTQRLRDELVSEGTDPDVWLKVEVPPECVLLSLSLPPHNPTSLPLFR